jgi:integrase
MISDKAMQARAGARDKWLIDDGARGAGRLVGRITPAGGRTFYFRYTRPDGERERLSIGPFEPRGDGRAAFTVQQARDKAREWSALYRAGVKDLREHFERLEAQRRRDAEAQRSAAVQAQQAAADAITAAARRSTVRTLFEQWQRAELAPQKLADGTRIGRKDGGEWVRLSFERPGRVFDRIGDVAAEDVKRADLLSILDDVKAEGRRRTANVLFADLRQMFRFAAEREIVARNPLDGIKRASIGGKDTERDRVLTPEELRILWDAVPKAGMASRSSVAIWLILATGARVGEAMGAVWDDVDLERRKWYLPETKNERDHTIHLSDFALRQFATLAGLRELGSDGAPVPWVFPNTARTGPVCVKSFSKQIADRRRETDGRMSNRSTKTGALRLPGGRWTPHDLRRTAATIMAGLGFSTDVIDECLNHKLQSKVARVYIQDRREAEQARAFDALGRHLIAICEDAPHGAQVIPIKATAAA